MQSLLPWKTILLRIVAVALMTGCAASGPPFTGVPPVGTDTGQIIVFRPDTLFQGGIAYQVNIDGQQAVVLKSGGFSVIDVKPGSRVIGVRAASWMQTLFRNPELTLNVMSRERTFVRVTPTRGNTVTLEVVLETQALSELKMIVESK